MCAGELAQRRSVRNESTVENHRGRRRNIPFFADVRALQQEACSARWRGVFGLILEN